MSFLQDRISRSVFNNPFIFDKRIGLGSIATISLTRYFKGSCVFFFLPISSGLGLEVKKQEKSRSFSSIRPDGFGQPINNPESLVLEHINSGKPTTSSIINKILLNQNLLITDSKLKQLLKVKGVELDISKSTLENKELLAELTGKSQYKGFSARKRYIYLYT